MKQYLVDDLPVVVNAALTLVLGGTLFLIITVAYRRVRRDDRQQRRRGAPRGRALAGVLVTLRACSVRLGPTTWRRSSACTGS